MKILIAGSRHLEIDPQDIGSFMYIFGFSEKESMIIHGNSGQVDDSADIYADMNSLEKRAYPANWKEYGKKAGPIRNKEMAKDADILLLIWDGISHGSLNMKKEMKGDRFAHLHDANVVFKSR